MHKSYSQLKVELEDILRWFESTEVDVDQALEKYSEAEKLLSQMQIYLNEKELYIEKKNQEDR
jgi:exonuclease VII small subunit